MLKNGAVPSSGKGRGWKDKVPLHSLKGSPPGWVLVSALQLKCDQNRGEKQAWGFFPTLPDRAPQNFIPRSITAITWWKLPFVSTVSVVGLKCIVSMPDFIISTFHSSEERQWPVTVEFMWGQLGRISCAVWSVKNCCVEGDNGFYGLVEEKKKKTKLCKPRTLGFQLWGMDLAPCLIATEINSNPVIMLIFKKNVWYFV